MFLVDHNSSLLPSGEIVHSWGFSFLPVYSLVQILVAVYDVANSNKTCGSFSFFLFFGGKVKHIFSIVVLVTQLVLLSSCEATETKKISGAMWSVLERNIILINSSSFDQVSPAHSHRCFQN